MLWPSRAQAFRTVRAFHSSTTLALLLSGCFMEGYATRVGDAEASLREPEIDASDEPEAAAEGDIAVAPASVDSGDPLRADGGADENRANDAALAVPLDGGMDADTAMDAAATLDTGAHEAGSTADARSDADSDGAVSKADTTVDGGTRCGSSAACTQRCASGQVCDFDCADAGVCNVTCETGSTCSVACRGDGTCNLACEGNASCVAVCRASTACPIACDTNALCTKRCDTGDRCEVEGCFGPKQSCPMAAVCHATRCM